MHYRGVWRPTDARHTDCRTRTAAAPGKKPPRGGFFPRLVGQSSATFWPSLYVYSVMAGFFSSPLGSNWMVAVTPL